MTILGDKNVVTMKKRISTGVCKSNLAVLSQPNKADIQCVHGASDLCNANLQVHNVPMNVERTPQVRKQAVQHADICFAKVPLPARAVQGENGGASREFVNSSSLIPARRMLFKIIAVELG